MSVFYCLILGNVEGWNVYINEESIVTHHLVSVSSELFQIMIICFWFELCWKPEQGISCAVHFEACCSQFLFTESAFIWFVIRVFLLLPKQLQVWKEMRQRTTSNLLACLKGKKTSRNNHGKKKEKRKIQYL